MMPLCSRQCHQIALRGIHGRRRSALPGAGEGAIARGRRLGRSLPLDPLVLVELPPSLAAALLHLNREVIALRPIPRDVLPQLFGRLTGWLRLCRGVIGGLRLCKSLLQYRGQISDLLLLFFLVSRLAPLEFESEKASLMALSMTAKPVLMAEKMPSLLIP